MYEPNFALTGTTSDGTNGLVWTETGPGQDFAQLFAGQVVTVSGYHATGFGTIPSSFSGPILTFTAATSSAPAQIVLDGSTTTPQINNEVWAATGGTVTISNSASYGTPTIYFGNET